MNNVDVLPSIPNSALKVAASKSLDVYAFDNSSLTVWSLDPEFGSGTSID